MALAEDWITTYGDDLKAIICENDDMGMGALSAAQAAGRDDIIIGGVDGLDDAVAAVKDGCYGCIRFFRTPQDRDVLVLMLQLQQLKAKKLSLIQEFHSARSQKTT